jgi:hypothetical protein
MFVSCNFFLIILPGVSLMEQKSMSLFSPHVSREAVAIIGTIISLAQTGTKKNSGIMERLLNHDVLEPLLRIAFKGGSIVVRTLANRAVGLLLPHTTPDSVLTIMKGMDAGISSFLHFCVSGLGSLLNPFYSGYQNSKPLNFPAIPHCIPDCNHRSYHVSLAHLFRRRRPTAAVSAYSLLLCCFW